MVNRTVCFLTIHSAGQLVLLPYGHPEISAPNYAELVCVCVLFTSSNPVTSSCDGDRGCLVLFFLVFFLRAGFSR